MIPKAYSKEFKRRAIDLVLSDGGRSKVVSAQIGISHSCLDGWVRQAKIDQGKLLIGSGLTAADELLQYSNWINMYSCQITCKVPK